MPRSNFFRRRAIALALLLAVSLSAVALYAQAGFEDDRVMLQGFYWESSRYGYPDQFPTWGKDHWYVVVRNDVQAIHDAHFDLIWLPPPSYTGHNSAGYDPVEYFRLDNSYGTFDEHRALLQSLLQSGVEPVADIVINHRNGETGWADFKNPDWGSWAICRDDEYFSNPASQNDPTPADQRGDCEETADYLQPGNKTYAYSSFRDIAHPNSTVRHDIARYLLQLKSFGYRGWRYDMVHGYHAKWIAYYNGVTQPTFSVGEYDWGAHDQQRGWMWATSQSPSAT